MKKKEFSLDLSKSCKDMVYFAVKITSVKT